MLAASGLGYEVAVTSLFAVVLEYHYAFLAVSLGLMGFGLGALPARAFLRSRRGAPPVAALALAAAATMLLTTALILRFPSGARVGLYLAALLLPFGCLGAALSCIYGQYPQRSGLLYGLDLGGAALGALLTLLALNTWGGAVAAGLLALLPALAAAVVAFGDRKWRMALPALLLMAAAAVPRWDLNLAAYSEAPPDKTMMQALAGGAAVTATRWDAFARTDLVTDPADPDRQMLFADGGAGSYLFRWDGTEAGLAPFRQQMEYLPFAVTAPKKVLVIGPGGGLDILLALAAGATDITAVEINPGLVQLVRQQAAYTGALFDRPGVHVTVADGRNFAATTLDRYDLILLNLVYTQAAEARSFALTENYIFTTEAFRRYYDLSTDSGSVAVVAHSALEASRALLTGVAALGDRGAPPPAALKQMALLMTPNADPTLRKSIFLLQRRPFAPEQVAALMASGLTPIHVPGQAEQALAGLATGKQTLQAFLKDSEYNLTPTSDDRPFFFQLDPGLPESLQILLAVSLLLFAVLSWLVWGFRSRGKGFGPFYGHAALLGAAFMLVELPLIQKAMLLLGSPQWSLALVVTALLLGAGLGSLLLSARLDRRLAVGGAGALAIVYRFALPWLTAAILPLGALTRGVFFALLLLPLGACLGIPFPKIIRSAGEHRPADVPLLYSVSGVASVLGAALAMTLAITLGFSWVLTLGALLYLALLPLHLPAEA